MKRKRIILGIGICVLVVVVAGFALWPRETEPVYQGKPLSYWAGEFADTYRTRDYRNDPEAEAHRALQSIGTNALPPLLRWIKYQPSPFRKKLESFEARLPAGISDWVLWVGRDKNATKAEDASTVFEVLRTNAAPAVTELTRLMNDASRPDVSARAIYSLSRIGAPAFPSMLEAFTRTNSPLRDRIIDDFRTLQAHGADVSPAFPRLLEVLEGPDPDLSAEAAYVLGSTRLNPEVSVPIIARLMTSRIDQTKITCAEALARFGPAASNALPQLLSGLSEPNFYSFREACTNAIRTIAPELIGKVVSPASRGDRDQTTEEWR